MGLVAEARHRRRAGLRGHACAVPRRSRRPRLSREIHRRSRPASKRICRSRTPEWAAAITGLPVAEIEAFARLVGTTKTHLLPAGLWLCAPAQRRGQHACGVLHRRRHRLPGNMRAAAPSIRTRTSSSSTRACSKAAAHARSRASAISTSRSIGRVLTGDAEALYGGPPVTAMLIQNTNPGQCRARAAAGEAGLAARRPVHLRARAVHDRHGQARRCRAAGDDVPRARRHLPRRRQPAHHAGAEADRAAGRTAHQPLRHRGTGQAARRRRHAGLRPDRAAAYRLSCWASAGLAISPASRKTNGSTCSRISRPRISSTASRHTDGKFRFRPDWTGTHRAEQAAEEHGPARAATTELPEFPDHVDLIEVADAEHPFRLATSPARNFLNSTFTETPASKAAGRSGPNC